MRRSLRWLLVPLLIVSLSGPGFGADSAGAKKSPSETEKKATPAKSKKSNSPTRQGYRGEITSLDAKAGTVSVKGAGGEKNFATQDAARDSIEGLAAGERVKVSYFEKEGKLIATSIRRIKAKSANSGKDQTKSAAAPKQRMKEGGESAPK